MTTTVNAGRLSLFNRIARLSRTTKQELVDVAARLYSAASPYARDAVAAQAHLLDSTRKQVEHLLRSAPSLAADTRAREFGSAVDLPAGERAAFLAMVRSKFTAKETWREFAVALVDQIREERRKAREQPAEAAEEPEAAEGDADAAQFDEAVQEHGKRLRRALLDRALRTTDLAEYVALGEALALLVPDPEEGSDLAKVTGRSDAKG